MLKPVTLKSPFNGCESDGQAEMDTYFYIETIHFIL